MSDDFQFDPDSFQTAGELAIAAVRDYLANVSQQPVRPEITPPEMFARFDDTLQDDGIGIEQAVRETSELVFANSMAMSHPLYLGLVNSSPLPPAILGDLFTSTIDNNNGAFHQGPAIAAAEREVIRGILQLLNYDGQGLLLPGGSYVNFHALQLARTHHFPQWQSAGPTSVVSLPRIYVSRSAHFSVRRAAVALGLGEASIGAVNVDARGAMDYRHLQQLIDSDRQAGHQPFAIVATAGTTGTGAIDNLSKIVRIGKREQLWVHVDACYGGAALLVPELRSRFAGIEQADSIAIDLHKWFYMPLTAGLVVTRHEQTVADAFDVNVSYIPNTGHVDAYRRGLTTSRRGCGLTVWLAIRAVGWKTVRAAVARDIDLTRYLEEQLNSSGFRVLPDGELSIACARFEPPGMDAAALESLQEEIAEGVRARGTAWFATTRHADQSWLRFNLVNLHTRRKHIDHLVEVLREVAAEKASRASCEGGNGV